MATLRQKLDFMNVIMDKKNPEKMYLVLHEETHNVWVIDMEGKNPPFELAKKMINMVYIKVDPKAVKVLFSERADENINSNPDYGPVDDTAGQQGG